MTFKKRAIRSRRKQSRLAFARYCHKGPPVPVIGSACGERMKYLNVAEKNDAAKTIAGLLSRGASQRREGYSQYNKIYEFDYNVHGQSVKMVMTSVSGHLLTHEFLPSFRSWHSCSPEDLFDAPVRKNCPESYQNIRKTLERETRGCTALIIWTDCDREGENIGFEVIEVCTAVKAQLRVFRAKFSEITATSIKRAIENLVQPDARQNAAVNVRSELDLRIGAAFTRYQTLRLQRIFPQDISNSLVSYGSCQIPTLGFVAQRYKEIENFIPQGFWKIKLTHTIGELTVEFNWARNRLFDKQCCEAYLMVCQANPHAKVVNVTEKPKNKWRPTPMDTVELEKLGSRKLKMNAKQVMTIAEKLYTQGIISYPRTETNMFTADMKLAPLVQAQVSSPQWGSFAEKVLQWGPNPRNGKKSDQAHPPIHPTKLPTNLAGDEWRVYELIARHFLACVSRDATGSETIVNVVIGEEEEEFTASGLCIHERNYLEVYPYDRWNAREIHAYRVGHTFEPTELGLHEGSTTAPNMLTEADLIALMEKHGIGTDATHADHINTIKERGYIGERDRGFLVPGTLGMGLVEGYEMMELRLAHPELRAGLEVDLKLICEGRKDPDAVLAEQIAKYKEVYRVMSQKARSLDQALGQRLNQTPRDPPPDGAAAIGGASLMKEVCKCPKCGQTMCLRQKRDATTYHLGCLGFPDCRNSVWFDDSIREATVSDDTCARCGSKKMVVKFRQLHYYGLLQSTGMSEYRTCIVCDSKFRGLLNINEASVCQATAPPAGTTNGWGTSANQTTRPAASSTARTGNGDGRTNSNTWGTSSSQTNRLPPPGGRENGAPNGIDRSNGPTSGTSSWGQSGNTSSGGWGTSQSSASNRGTNSGTSSWGKPPDNRNSTWGRPDGGQQQAGEDNNEILCRCGTPAIQLTVRKEGPNTGRPFYTCPNQADKCGFFKWGDEDVRPASGGWASGGGGGGGGGSSGWGSAGQSAGPSRGSSSSSGQTGRRGNNDSAGSGAAGSRPTKTVRKCGLCRQEGHTKTKCPQRASDE